MNIVILTTIANGFGKKGFYQSQENGLARELASRGHKVTIIKWVSRKSKFENSHIGENIELYYIPGRSMGVHGKIALRVFKNLSADADVVLCFADTQLFLPKIIKFCLKNRIVFLPYVGVGHSAQRNLKSKILDRRFRKTTLKLYYKTGVIAKTPQAADEFRKLGVQDIETAPVGVDTVALNMDFRRSDRNQIRAELGYSEDDIVISYVARLTEDKNPTDAIEIFNHVSSKDQTHSYKMMIVGDGQLKDKVEKAVGMSLYKKNIKMFGRLPYNEIWKMHYAADFFLDLSSREIFGMALTEAIFYESSVAAVHAPGPDSILPGMRAHKLCDSYSDIEKRILSGKPDPSDLRADSETLLERFSWKHCANIIEKKGARKGWLYF